MTCGNGVEDQGEVAQDSAVAAKSNRLLLKPCCRGDDKTQMLLSDISPIRNITQSWVSLLVSVLEYVTALITLHAHLNEMCRVT